MAEAATIDPAGDAGGQGAGGAGAGAGDGGGPVLKWWEGLGDAGLKTSPNITRYETVDDAAKALDEATKRLGVPPDQLLRLPTKPDDADAWNDLYKRLGRPDAPEGYNLQLPPDAGEELKATAGELATAAHAAGLTPTQLRPLVELLNRKTTEAAESEIRAREDETRDVSDTLKREWGGKFQTYKAEIGKLLTELGAVVDEKTGASDGGAAAIRELNERGLGNSLALNRMLAKIVDLRAEPGRLPGSGAAPEARSGDLTPAQAEAKMRELEGDPERGKALTTRDHPMHKAMVAERDRLARIAAGQTV